MMRVAIYGHTFNEKFIPYIQEFFGILFSHDVDILFFKPFLKYVQKLINFEKEFTQLFSVPEDIFNKTDLIISIGGDGTFLETLPFAIHGNIPVIGLNSGRLGFLANISKEELSQAFNSIFLGKYTIEERVLIQFKSPDNIFDGVNFALNEVTVQKKGSSMLNIDSFVDDEFLNTYWTDGIIISTPTGSTAYSLSVGGPIVVPKSNTFIIAPIASHNLTVRPIVIPDDSVIKLKVSSRESEFLITADSKTHEIKNRFEFSICKAEKRLKIINLPTNNYFSTLRNKLMWGVDSRN